MERRIIARLFAALVIGIFALAARANATAGCRVEYGAIRAASATPSGTGNPGSGNEADCRRFVQRFYDWYVRAAKNSGFETAIDRKPGSFNRTLLRALRADRAAQKRSSGEIIGLDFDPIVNGQDMAKLYEVGKITRKGDRYRAEVFTHFSAERPAHPSVVPELRREHGRWGFVNFHYPAEAGGGSENLLAILDRLRKDRAKGR